MIACYTVVGPSLMAKGGPLIRSDLAGVWQMGSPVAVEMVNLPTTFLTVLARELTAFLGAFCKQDL